MGETRVFLRLSGYPFLSPCDPIGNYGEEASIHPHLQQAQQGVEEDVSG